MNMGGSKGLRHRIRRARVQLGEVVREAMRREGEQVEREFDAALRGQRRLEDLPPRFQALILEAERRQALEPPRQPLDWAFAERLLNLRSALKATVGRDGWRSVYAAMRKYRTFEALPPECQQLILAAEQDTARRPQGREG
jgi:hypothetical protein